MRPCRAFTSAWFIAAALASSASAEESITLFNGEDLSGWTFDLSDESKSIEDVWSVEDGVLKCQGKPSGVLRTVDDYENYRLTVQWRWPGKGGNNGVLVHASKPRELSIWPKSLEVQLASRNAGDFWTIGVEVDVPDEATRRKGRRRLNLTDDSEKPLGEWNTMEIVCNGDSITVHVNGELVNEGTNLQATRGAICLQSEGTPIEYRKVVLTPIGGE